MAEKAKKKPVPKPPTTSTTTAPLGPGQPVGARQLGGGSVPANVGVRVPGGGVGVSATAIDELRRALLMGETTDGVELGNAPITTVSGRLLRQVGESPASGKTTVNQAMSDLLGMSQLEIERLQDKLIDAGIIPPGAAKTLRRGQADPTTRAAYRLLLEEAVLRPDTPLTEILASRRAEQPQDQEPGVVGGNNTYRISVSDPAELRKLADTISVDILGRRAEPGEQARIVAAIQGAEVSNQRALNGAQEAAERTEFAIKATAASGAKHPLGEAKGRVTGKFGEDRDGGKRQHGGVDFAIQMRTPVSAPVGGTVVAKSDPKGYGTYAVLQGDDGREYRFAHLDSVTKTGRVEAGTAIAATGNSGRSTGPHLHFEVREKGQAVDPEAFLAGAVGAPGAPGTSPAPATYLPSTTVTTTEVNPAARAEEALRAENPTEAASHDIANVFSQFRSLIGGRANG